MTGRVAFIWRENKTMFKKITLGLLIAVFGSSLAVAGEPAKTEEAKKVACEVTKDGKTETQEVANAEECTKLGGKVKEEKKAEEKVEEKK